MCLYIWHRHPRVGNFFITQQTMLLLMSGSWSSRTETTMQHLMAQSFWSKQTKKKQVHKFGNDQVISKRTMRANTDQRCDIAFSKTGTAHDKKFKKNWELTHRATPWSQARSPWRQVANGPRSSWEPRKSAQHHHSGAVKACAKDRGMHSASSTWQWKQSKNLWRIRYTHTQFFHNLILTICTKHEEVGI